MSVSPIPSGYRTITPYLVVKGAERALDFYARAFGAVELFRMPMGDRIGHAEMRLGDSALMLADEFPEMGALSPETLGGAGMSLMVYVEDVDALFRRALEAGATEVRPLQNEFYGDRAGTLRDPFGHRWTLATHVENVTPEQMEERMEGRSQSARKRTAAKAVM